LTKCRDLYNSLPRSMPHHLTELFLLLSARFA
jgi:hypothetical protein